ncbi:MAG: ROK family protein [Verrucomicrobiales bacterium]
MKTGIGIDLGGTQIKGAVFNLDSGEIIEKKIVPSLDGETIDYDPAFLVQVRKLIAELGGEKAHHIGVSAPGMANKEATAISYLPERLDGIEGLIWSDEIGRTVSVINDAHAALKGEVWQGSAKECRDVIFLTLGTGVGGAVICDGKLLRGSIGRAGHLGHIPIDFRKDGDICGMPGSLEDFVGNHNISERSEGKFESTHLLVTALADGDPDAERVWEESMRALAAGIAGLINIFDPEAVIIGGGISAAWFEIEFRLKRFLEDFEWRPDGHQVPVRKAELGEWAGVYGAMAFAMDEKFSK